MTGFRKVCQKLYGITAIDFSKQVVLASRKLDLLRLQNINENKEEINLIVRSEADYLKFVVSYHSDLPQINFSENILYLWEKNIHALYESNGN